MMEPLNASYPYAASAYFSERCKLKLHVARATSFIERFMGLMGKAHLPPASGLIFERCTSIHMFFMRLSLDVIWARKMSGGYEVLALASPVKPWTLAFAPKDADVAIEFPVGTFDEVPTRIQVEHESCIDDCGNF